MPLCARCGEQTPSEKELLEVKTLHIRDISGERRIQGLGEIVRGAVCDACAQKHMSDVQNPGIGLAVRVAAFLAMSVAGAVLFFVFEEIPLKLPCAAAVFMGLACAYNTKAAADKKRGEMASLAPDRALEAARMEVLCACLPQKDEDGSTDITYIEISDELITANPESLALEYMLLPVIAKQAIERAGQHRENSSG